MPAHVTPGVAPEPLSQNAQHATQRRLRTVKQFCAENPAFSPGGMRWLLFSRRENGLDHAVVRCGRRIFIDADRFFAWLDEQNGIAPQRHGEGHGH
jgi:hypothetical protein